MYIPYFYGCFFWIFWGDPGYPYMMVFGVFVLETFEWCVAFDIFLYTYFSYNSGVFLVEFSGLVHF